MPLLTHKFSNQAGADKFSKRLQKMGFKPFQTRRTKIVKGLKRFVYVVEYLR